MTGMRPDTTTIHDLSHPVRKTVPDILTMPQHFRRSGYETVSLGKIYHHGSDDNGIGWSVKAWHPKGDWKGRGYLNPESQARTRDSAASAPPSSRRTSATTATRMARPPRRPSRSCGASSGATRPSSWRLAS
jgi:arylsulfatase A-like enzyme